MRITLVLNAMMERFFVLGAPRPGQAEHLPWLHDAWLATVKTRRRG